MHPSSIDHNRPVHLRVAAVRWLLVGTILLLSTMVPAHTVLLGWAPLLWLLITPVVALLVLQTEPPRRGRAHRRAPRRGAQPVWH